MSNDYGPLFAGEALRNTGITTVTQHNESWMEKSVKLAKVYTLNHNDFTGEDIRFFCEGIIDPPQHPNAWGALVNHLVRRKLIRATGKYRQPKDRTSHARAIQVYEAF